LRKLGHVLRAAVDNEDVLRAARAQATLREWSDIVGPTLSLKSWPDRYSRGTVWIAVQGSAWATELRMMKGVILDRLRERSGEASLFVDIRFGVRKLPEPLGKVETESCATPSTPAADERKFLTIQEIAAKRLSKWKE